MAAMAASTVNSFLLMPLCGADHSGIVDLRLGEVIAIGRRSHPHVLSNLHISREQVTIEVAVDFKGHVLIKMTNKGKNSTRVLSIQRRKQARVTTNTFCRLVPGDIVELLYDQQGRYAFKLVETTGDGRPLLEPTPLVPSVSHFVSPAAYMKAQADARKQAAVPARMPGSLLELVRFAAEVATGAGADAQAQQSALQTVLPDTPAFKVLLAHIQRTVESHSSAELYRAMVLGELDRQLLLDLSGGGGSAASHTALPGTAAAASPPPPPNAYALPVAATAAAAPAPAPDHMSDAVMPGEAVEASGSPSAPPLPRAARNTNLTALLISAVAQAVPLLRESQHVGLAFMGRFPSAFPLSEQILVGRSDVSSAATAAQRKVDAALGSNDAALPAPLLAIMRLNRPSGALSIGINAPLPVVADPMQSAFGGAGAGAGAGAGGGGGSISSGSASPQASDFGLSLDAMVPSKALLPIRSANDAIQVVDSDVDDADDEFAAADDDEEEEEAAVTPKAAARSQRVPAPSLGKKSSRKGAAGLARADSPASAALLATVPPTAESFPPMPPVLPPQTLTTSASTTSTASWNVDFQWNELSVMDIPHGVLGHILSFLPMHEIAQAAAVCREWREEIRRPGSVRTVDFGAYFAGRQPPDPVLLDKIARQINGRELSFGNCAWLSTGALLHLMGVPVGVEPVHLFPRCVEEQSGQLNAEQRAAKAGGLALKLAEEAKAGTAAHVATRPYASCRPSHSFARLFLGELSDYELRSLGWDLDREVLIDVMDSALTTSNNSEDGDMASSSPAEALSVAEELSPPATAAASAAAAAAATGALISQVAAAASNSFMPATGGSSSSSSSSSKPSLSSLRPWWWSVDRGYTDALCICIPPPDLPVAAPGAPPAEGAAQPVSAPDSRQSQLPVQDLALAFIQSEVVRARAVRQYEHMFLSMLPGNSGQGDDLRSFGVLVARAYVEMSVVLRSVLHRYKELRTAGSSGAAGNAAAAAAAAAAAMADSDTDNSQSSGNTQPTKPSNLLLSGRPVFDAQALVASAAVFAQVAEMRASAGQATDAEEVAAAGGSKPPIPARLRNRPPADITLRASDSATAGVLEQTAHIHALAVAYSTAASDLFDFSFRLANSKQRAASAAAAAAAASAVESAGSGADGRLRGDSPATPSPVSPPLRNRFATAASTDSRAVALPAWAGRNTSNGGSSPSEGDAAPLPVDRLAAAFSSFEVPFPGHTMKDRARGCCCTSLSERKDGVAECAHFGGAFCLHNVLGNPLPQSFTSPITGLDLHGCIRLAPQNLSLILRYCPHLTSLRLGACNQLTWDVLVSLVPHLSKLKQLDLDYLTSVNDDVLIALGRHCPNLMRLQLVGCSQITDAGIGASGLLAGCIGLRRLNLRGCRNITDAGITDIAKRCVQLRELCLAGLSSITSNAILQLLLNCRKLARFKAELWSDPAARPAADGEVAEEAPEGPAGRRFFRLLSSVRAAVRHIVATLPHTDTTTHAALAQRYPNILGSSTGARRSGVGGGGAGAGGAGSGGSGGGRSQDSDSNTSVTDGRGLAGPSIADGSMMLDANTSLVSASMLDDSFLPPVLSLGMHGRAGGPTTPLQQRGGLGGAGNAEADMPRLRRGGSRMSDDDEGHDEEFFGDGGHGAEDGDDA